jgi:hypothetical protein
MKKFAAKKVFALLAAGVMTVGGLAGCGEKQTGLEDFKNRPNKVSVVYNANAYGKEWITQIAKEYMTNYNQDTYIYLEQTVTPIEEASKIQSDSASADLYLFDHHLYDLEYNVEKLEDVWDSYPVGEDGQVKIKDKLSPLLKSMKDPRNTRSFVVPYSQGTTYGFVYNKTVLDEAFPNGYTLPRTTEELFEMGDALKTVDLANIKEDQDAYLLSCSYADSNENLRYSQQTWFYQLLGYEKSLEYFEGRYWDETQEKYVFDEEKPTVFEKYKDTLKEFYEIVYKLTTAGNGYVHKDASSMESIYAGGAVAGAGFKANKSKVAFKVDGPYFEEETKMFLEPLKNRGQEQTMGMMHFPMASGIIKRLATVNDDATLRQVISFVDGETETAPAGVSEADIAEVRKARSVTPMYLGGGMVIPKTAANKDGAKEFIRFMCSDVAAVASAKALKGLEILPYGKVVSNEELGFEKSHFISSVSKWQTENLLLTAGDGEFATWGDFGLGANTATVGSSIFKGNGKTAEAWWQAAYTDYEYNWADKVRNYKAHGGVTD